MRRTTVRSRFQDLSMYERSKRDRLARPRTVVRLLVALRELLSPPERAALDEARAGARDAGDDTQRFTERDRLVAIGVIRPREAVGGHCLHVTIGIPLASEHEPQPAGHTVKALAFAKKQAQE